MRLNHDSIQTRLTPPDPSGPPVSAVLDTDTFNEIDDQFALAYALLSPERIALEAVYAAPFINPGKATSAREGMEKSYEEIHEVYRRLSRKVSCPVYKGSEAFMTEAGGPLPSPARDDLIERAMARQPDEDPLYVVAIGACTNIASALEAEPGIQSRIVVVWLGGQPWYWPSAKEYNLKGDLKASQALFDSGVPLVHVPCINVAQKLRTSVPELRHYLEGRNELCDFLFERFEDFESFEMPRRLEWNAGRPVAYGKEIWDVAPLAWLIDPSWCGSELRPRPVLTNDMTWAEGNNRHPIRQLNDVIRDRVFGDLFTKLAGVRPTG
jgi:inosine-uridine nucleoside N-ribohydrolase